MNNASPGPKSPARLFSAGACILRGTDVRIRRAMGFVARPAPHFNASARALAAVLLLGCPFIYSCDSHNGSTFTGLGIPRGCSDSYTFAVSGDGMAAAINAPSASGFEVFRWTAAGGMVHLGHLPGCNNNNAFGLSNDGSVVVGWDDSSSERLAFRWTAAGGTANLGFLPGGKSTCEARATSHDGSVVAGWCMKGSTVEAFRWTAAGGMTGIGFLPGHDASQAYGASSNASVIVGWCQADSSNEAFRWTAAGGMVSLGFLPGSSNSFAEAVSADGLVAVGYCDVEDSGFKAFRWTAAGGMVSLGKDPGERDSSHAAAVSGDGSVIVGHCSGPAGEAAFVWDATHGMRILQSVLTQEYNLSMTGWILTRATGISTDGKTIVGIGRHWAHEEVWIAHLDRPVNAPAVRSGKK